MNIFKQRLHDIDMQDWISSLNDFDYLRTYKILKDGKYVEPYTWNINNFHLRKYLARFRCGYIDIHDNSGRINDINYEDRICKYCNLNDIDAEFHFLLRCAFHRDLRKKYIPNYFILHPNFSKFRSLVNTE